MSRREAGAQAHVVEIRFRVRPTLLGPDTRARFEEVSAWHGQGHPAPPVVSWDEGTVRLTLEAESPALLGQTAEAMVNDWAKDSGLDIEIQGWTVT